MGALLTGSRWAALAALAPLAGCFQLFVRTPDCVPVERKVALPAPYNQYFASQPLCNFSTQNPVAARSSQGLTDSYGGNCLLMSSAFDYSGLANCETICYEQRSTFDYASLYGYSFGTCVEQSADGPRLRLSDQSSVSAAASPELTYRFADGRAQLTYRDANNLTQTFTPGPAVTELRNFASGTRTYAQVWQLTNPLNAAQGRPTAVTAYYVDRDYGLIAFGLRDGSRWTLAR